MSVTPELVRSKLSSLDSTQESIVSVSSWLMFHRRAATQIVDVWLQAVKDGSSNRKLSLVYLANEVAQQSRAKKRVEYPEAFAKIIPEAIENVFRHATTDVQGKITRVVDVWKQRSIFPPQVLAELAKRLETRTKSPTSARSMAIPSDLQKISSTYMKLLGSASSSSLTLGTANNLYASLVDADPQTRPSAEMHAAKLAQLSKALDQAKVNVQASITLREELFGQLSALTQLNAAALERERATLNDLTQKQNVAQRIVYEDVAQPDQSEMDAPQVEALTPVMEAEVSSETPIDPFAIDFEPRDSEMTHDPVARLQMELDPSLSALLARKEEAASASNGDAILEEPYMP